MKVLTFIPRMPGEPWREDGRLEIKRVSVNQVGECNRLVFFFLSNL